VDRRRFLLTSLAGVLAAPFTAEAGKVYRVGVLSPEVPPPGFLAAFREGLRDFGHVDGQNISLELRDAKGANERLPDLARESRRA
jgi:putative tryptophan/tyrosine transport system substrate-binding protein